MGIGGLAGERAEPRLKQEGDGLAISQMEDAGQAAVVKGGSSVQFRIF